MIDTNDTKIIKTLNIDYARDTVIEATEDTWQGIVVLANSYLSEAQFRLQQNISCLPQVRGYIDSAINGGASEEDAQDINNYMDDMAALGQESEFSQAMLLGGSYFRNMDGADTPLSSIPAARTWQLKAALSVGNCMIAATCYIEAMATHPNTDEKLEEEKKAASPRSEEYFNLVNDQTDNTLELLHFTENFQIAIDQMTTDFGPVDRKVFYKTLKKETPLLWKFDDAQIEACDEIFDTPVRRKIMSALKKHTKVSSASGLSFH